MNDFTKEELEIIKSWCISKIDMAGLVNFVGTSERELQKKIASMIENYACDHFAVIKLDENFHPISTAECVHCHKPME